MPRKDGLRYIRHKRTPRPRERIDHNGRLRTPLSRQTKRPRDRPRKAEKIIK